MDLGSNHGTPGKYSLEVLVNRLPKPLQADMVLAYARTMPLNGDGVGQPMEVQGEGSRHQSHPRRTRSGW